jgi:hypothetical protein
VNSLSLLLAVLTWTSLPRKPISSALFLYMVFSFLPVSFAHPRANGVRSPGNQSSFSEVQSRDFFRGSKKAFAGNLRRETEGAVNWFEPHRRMDCAGASARVVPLKECRNLDRS